MSRPCPRCGVAMRRWRCPACGAVTLSVTPRQGGGLLLAGSLLWLGLVAGSAATLGCALAAWRLAATGVWLREARAAALVALLAAAGSLLCYRLLRAVARHC